MNRIVWTRALLMGLLAAFALGLLAHPAHTTCIDYADYLTWFSKVEFDATVESVAVRDGLAFFPVTGAGTSHLQVVDISDGRSPVMVGQVELPGAGARDVALAGNLAAIACKNANNSGLYLVDISDPFFPVVTDSFYSSTEGWFVTATDSLILAATSYPGNYADLLAVDVTDPSNPVAYPAQSTSLHGGGGLIVNGTHLYMGSLNNLITFDVSDPAAIVSIDADQISFPNVIVDMVPNRSRLLLVTRNGVANSVTLHSCDISNPTDPILAGQITTGLSYGGSFWPGYPRLTVDANVCYIGCTDQPLESYDVSNPSTLTLIDVLAPPNGPLIDLAASDNLLFRITENTVDPDLSFADLISVSSPSPLEPVGSLALPGETLGVVLAPGKAGIAYVAGGSAGLQVVDVSDPQNPFILGTADTPGSATEIALVGTTAFVADSDAGLQVVNVAVTTAPTIIGAVDTPGLAVDIKVAGDFAYIADSGQGLRIVDVSTPTDPVLRGAEPLLTEASGVDLDGLTAFVANGSGGLRAVDVSDPDNPWIVGGVKGRDLGDALRVDVAQDVAYVSAGTAGLAVVDIRDPAHLAVTATLGTESTAGDVSAWGLFAYVGSGSSVHLVDIQDDQNPIVVGQVNVPSISRGMFVDEFYAYVADSDAGLQICPTQCGFDGSVSAAFESDLTVGLHPVTATFTNQSSGYGLSYTWDFGDGVGSSTEKHPTYTFAAPGDHIVTLIADNGAVADTFTVMVSALAESPTIVSVTDVPLDQGGWVYVDFYHSLHDTGDLNRAEIYTVQRLDDGRWVSIATPGAWGDHYYTALAPTQGNGSDQWFTSFRVIASMDEGNWASAPVSGFSLDNLPPLAPTNVTWSGPGLLTWNPVPDNDLAYYLVYGGSTAVFENADIIANTGENSVDLGDELPPWVFVVAVDDSRLESDPSLPLAVSGVPDTPRGFWLAAASPNPFNPLTTIEYSLPAGSHTRLGVFDMAGRLVKTLVDEPVAGGKHTATWRGRDSLGQEVSSGTYFYRLEAGGKIQTRRMTLVR